MLAFNLFFLEPVHTFTLADSRNWLALLVFLVTSVVVSELATRSRRRAREAALLAEIATTLLEHGTVAVGARRDLGRGGAGAERRACRDHARRGRDRRFRADRSGAPHRDDQVEGGDSPARAAGSCPRSPRCSRSRSIASDSQHEALEAEALRRADAIKTAVLRSVSHDLRTPLMAISTSAGALARPDLAIDDEDRAELLATILAASDRLDRLVGEPARPLAPPGRRRRAGAAAGRRSTSSSPARSTSSAPTAATVEVSLPDDSALGARRRPPGPAGARQPGRERPQVLAAATTRCGCRSTGTPSEAAIRVIDHGPGVEPAERDRIFEPFQRGERAGAARRRPRPRDRPRLRGGERRQPLGRVARRPGRDVRAQVPGRRAGPAGRDARMSAGPQSARRRRRAADPARAAHEPPRRRLRGRDGRHGRGRARRRRRCGRRRR